MKKTSLAAALTLSTIGVALPVYSQRRPQGGGGSRPAPVRTVAPRPRVVIRLQRVSVPKPDRIVHPEHIVRDNRQINFPQRYDNGARITKPAAIAPPQHHAQIVGNHALVKNIVQREIEETQANHYYWHADGRLRYCHYLDASGVNWYGFYHGPAFYWTRHWANRWWWYDPHFNRWVYWWSGYWWWPAPGGLVYIYTNDSYYPYEPDGSVTVATPELQTPPAAAPAPTEGQAVLSSDSTRMAQIDDQGDAYLYDQSSGKPVYLKFLAHGVSNANFSGGNGHPLRIMLEFENDSFALFDGDGNPLDAPSATSDETPGPPPDSTPPMPAPGSDTAQ